MSKWHVSSVGCFCPTTVVTIPVHATFLPHRSKFLLQGSVERANRSIQEKLSAWMRDNHTKSWSEGLRFVQFQLNTQVRIVLRIHTFTNTFYQSEDERYLLLSIWSKSHVIQSNSTSFASVWEKWKIFQTHSRPPGAYLGEGGGGIGTLPPWRRRGKWKSFATISWNAIPFLVGTDDYWYAF